MLVFSFRKYNFSRMALRTCFVPKVLIRKASAAIIGKPNTSALYPFSNRIYFCTSYAFRMPLLYTALTAAWSVGAITPNSSISSGSDIQTLPFGHQAVLPCHILLLLLQLFSYSCHCYTIKCLAQLIPEHRQVVVEFLCGYLRVDLGRDNVRVSQYTAHALDGHPLGQSQGSEGMTC